MRPEAISQVTNTFAISREIPEEAELIGLYRAVDWTAYTNEPDLLIEALRASYAVYAARSTVGELIGLARTVSDGHTIVYLQDLLVRPQWRRRGIGRALLRRTLEDASGIRQFVLMTDDAPAQRAFYQACGLTEAHEVTPGPLRSFVRIRY